MSYDSVLNEMQTIQSRLVQAGLLQASSAAKSTTSKASAASFAAALTDATATTSAAATISTAPTDTTASTAATATTAATDGTTIGANGVTGDDVVQAALTYKGTPYVLGGESKSGIDCSGLVQAAFSKVGVSVPRLVHEQETVGQKVDSLKDAKPGDLIVLNGGDHIAIYLGDNTVVHAPYAGRSVSVQKVWFNDSDITSIRRVVPATDDAGTSASATGTSATGAAASSSDAATTNANGLSLATVARATAMLTMFGADAGLYGDSSSSSSDSSSSSSSTSLSSLLSSFGITGSSSSASTSTDSTASLLASLGLSGTSSTTPTTSAATQQIVAARTAMYGTSA